MSYQYVTYNESGEAVKGRVSTTSDGAFVDLSGGGEAFSLRSLISSLQERLAASFFRVKPGEIILFYRQLAQLLESGIDIITSLGLLRSQTPNRRLNQIMGEIIGDLHGGNALSAALARHPAIFPPLYCQSIRVGEQTGNLEVMLRQVADYIEKQTTTSKGLKNALMYPIITAVVAIGVMGILVTVVLPAFSNLYSSLGAQLPVMTRMLLVVSTQLQRYGNYFMLAILIVVGIAILYFKTPAGKYRRDRWLFRLPLVGRVNHLNELSRCCRSISLLFRAGLPLTEIIPLVIQACRNRTLVEALTQVNQDMLKGEGLSRPMAKNPLFLPMMVQMVKVGEETGNLDTTLFSVAQNFEAEAEDRLRTLIGLLQPTMTLAIGLVVGLVTMSLFSAMYSIYGQLD